MRMTALLRSRADRTKCRLRIVRYRCSGGDDLRWIIALGAVVLEYFHPDWNRRGLCHCELTTGRRRPVANSQ